MVTGQHMVLGDHVQLLVVAVHKVALELVPTQLPLTVVTDAQDQHQNHNHVTPTLVTLPTVLVCHVLAVNVCLLMQLPFAYVSFEEIPTLFPGAPLETPIFLYAKHKVAAGPVTTTVTMVTTASTQLAQLLAALNL